MSRLMWDSDRAADIPLTATMVAGYVDGVNPWSAADWARFPPATRRLRIARSYLTHNADFLDSETGLATVSQAVTWASIQHRTYGWAGIYCDVARWPSMISAFTLSRVPQPAYWIAHWGLAPVVIPPGAVGVQYANATLSGGHFDLSLMADYIPGFDPVPPSTGGTVTNPITDPNFLEMAARVEAAVKGLDHTTFRPAPIPDEANPLGHVVGTVIPQMVTQLAAMDTTLKAIAAKLGV